MLCKKPFMNGNKPCPCGQCTNCRINRQRTWTHRMMLESLCHADNAFITLTYDPEHVPSDGSLVPDDVSSWIKRLRDAWYRRCISLGVEWHPLRFYAVGEYGDQTLRPHYHVALFGYPTCIHNRSRYTKTRTTCCPHCDLVRDTWKKGHVDLGSLTLASAQYVCQYVTKKMTHKDDPRLNGKAPEFARMSRRPGIGAPAMFDVATALFSEHGVTHFLETGDVPSALQHGGRKLPLGRYLKEKLRDEVGMDQTTRQKIAEAYDAQMFNVLLDAAYDAKTGQRDKEFLTFQKFLVEENIQKRRNHESRTKLYKQKRTL